MPTATTRRARELRTTASDTERKLWSRLRRRSLGERFRRQHPIGPYFADFACVAERLVIEVDGDTHREAYDLRRDAWLEAHGWSVMHVPVQDLDENFDDVVESIYARLHPREAESLYDPKFASPLRPEPLRG